MYMQKISNHVILKSIKLAKLQNLTKISKFKCGSKLNKKHKTALFNNYKF